MRRVIGASPWHLATVMATRRGITGGGNRRRVDVRGSLAAASLTDSGSSTIQMAHRGHQDILPPTTEQQQSQQQQQQERVRRQDTQYRSQEQMRWKENSTHGRRRRRDDAQSGSARKQRSETKTTTTTATKTGRFSHRHNVTTETSTGGREAGRYHSGAATTSVQPQHQRKASPRATSVALERLFKLHLTMRNNYESLRQCQQVFNGFSAACAEALLQLDLPLRRGRRLDTGETEDEIVVEVRERSTDESEDSLKDIPTLFLAADCPLYATPITFPPLSVEALVRSCTLRRPNTHVGSGDLLLAEMESPDVAQGESTAMGGNGATDTEDVDRTNIVWELGTPGLESIILTLQHVPLTEIVQLVETLAYFKWVKDEKFLIQRQGGSLAEPLRREVVALQTARREKVAEGLYYYYYYYYNNNVSHEMSNNDSHNNNNNNNTQTKDSANDGTRGGILENMVNAFIDCIPRVDRVEMLPSSSRIMATTNSSSLSLEPRVHVIDFMLNLLMRVCLWNWPKIPFGDQTVLTLLCSYPWFTQDLAVAAAAWMTYYHLQSLVTGDDAGNYQRTYTYIQRLRRLCWPGVNNFDTLIVRRLFLLDKAPADAAVVADDNSNNNSNGGANGSLNRKGPNQHNKAQQAHVEEQQTQALEETKSTESISFRELVCVLYGTSEKQRSAYELLLLWLVQANPADLHRASPHRHYISATSIGIADIDNFVMERFYKEHEKGNWLLLRPLESNCDAAGVVTAAVENLTQCVKTPYFLTRLFFCRYHSTIPHIWQGISAKRRELLWAAWLRSVARPMVNVILTNPVNRGENSLHFLESLITILSSDVMFFRFITRLVIVSLNDMVTTEKSLSAEELCVQFIELVYTGALILHCSVTNTSGTGCLINAWARTTITDTYAVSNNSNNNNNKNNSTNTTRTTEQEQQHEQNIVAAIRRPFKAAMKAVIHRLGVEHVPVAESLLDTFLFRIHQCDMVGMGPVHSIQRGVLQVCGEDTREILRHWLCRHAAMREEEEQVEKDENESEMDPIVRGWRRVVRAEEAGLRTTLPGLLECARGVLMLLKKRRHPLFDSQEKEIAKGEGEGVEVVFSLSELRVILTVLSRAMISRVSSLRAGGLTSISQEIISLTTSPYGDETGEKSSSNNSNSNRKNNDGHTAVVIANPSTSERALLLEKALSTEVASKASVLPWTSLLEAIEMHLVPYTILTIPYHALHGSKGAGHAKFHAMLRKMEEDIETRRHYRFLGNHLLYRYYYYIVPNDSGWADAAREAQMDTYVGKKGKDENSVVNGATSKESEYLGGNNASSTPQKDERDLQDMTWLLLRALVRGEIAQSKKMNKKRAATEEEEEASSATTTTNNNTTSRADSSGGGGGGVHMEEMQLERVLACHAMMAYMRLAHPDTSSPALHEVYEEFLQRATPTAAHLAGPHTDSDMIFLWLAAAATLMGVRFNPPRSYMWPTTGTTTIPQSPETTENVSLEERTMRVVMALAPCVQSELQHRSIPRLKFLVNVIVAIQIFGTLGLSMDAGSLSVDQLLLRASSERRLLYRHLNLFLVGSSALPDTRHALLHTASYLREARNILSPAEIERAFIAVALSADAFAKQHEVQADIQQQQGSIFDLAHSTAPTLRVTPTQLRHAWSALTRRVLESVSEMPTPVFVKGVHCAGAVACVDTLVFQQLLSYIVEFRQRELSLMDWTVILRTTRKSFEHQRVFEEYLQGPLQTLLHEMERQINNPRLFMQEYPPVELNGEQQLERLCLFVEALPEMFVGDAEFWELLRRALKAQWMMWFNSSDSNKQKQQPSKVWADELTRSYTWAVRTAGHHDLNDLSIH